MRKLIWIILALLLVLTGCDKKETKPDAPQEPEASVHTPAGEETRQDENLLTASYSEAQLLAKLAAVQLCPSLAEDHARWLTDPAEAPALQTALDGFAAWLTAHKDALPEIVDGHLWYLDQAADGTWHLQFWNFSAKNPSMSWYLHQKDGTVDLIQQETALRGLLHAVCASSSYDKAPDTADAAFVLRFVDCTGKDGYLHVFRTEGEPMTAMVQYARAGHSAVLDEIPARPLSALEQLAVEAALDLPWCDAPEMVRSFLQASFAYDGRIPWNIPAGYDSDLLSGCYDVRNAVDTLLAELALDPAMEQLFLQGPWTLSGFATYTVTSGDAVATVYPGGCVDMEDYLTPSRLEIQALAESGHGSETVPPEILAEFVDYVMADNWYHSIWTGDGGTVEWFWNTGEDGLYYLTAQAVNDAQKQASHQYQYDTVTVYWNGEAVVFRDQESVYDYGEK